MNNRIKNTRLVTFLADYGTKEYVNAKGEKVPARVISRKGTVTPMHRITAQKLKERGAKVEIKEFPYEQALKRAKAAFKAA